MAEQVIAKRTYVIVGLALLALTALTYALAHVNLRGWNTPVALAIALLKAAVIGLFFMHARYERAIARLIMAAGLLWLGILLVGTLDDFLTRGWLPVLGK